jgi:hypothetical protein
MRVEPDQVRAVLKLLRDWGVKINPNIDDDVVAEFDVKREDPGQERLGGFRRSDPDTSKKAAFDVVPRAGSQRRKALEALLDHDGLTYAGVEAITGINGVWKRLSELKQGGWIEVRGTRRILETGSEGDVYYPTVKAISWRKKRYGS